MSMTTFPGSKNYIAFSFETNKPKYLMINVHMKFCLKL